MENCELCARIETLLAEGAEKRKNTVAGMIEPGLIACDCAEMSTLIGFPAKSWEVNPNGVIHGGIIATMLDTAMGITTIAITDTLTPTIDLHISYLRPCPADGMIAVRSSISMAGGSIIYVRAEMFDTREPDKLIATSAGSFKRMKNAKPFEW